MAASAGYFYKEKLLICPYNWAHSILKSRLQTHLVKCMKSYPDSGKVICPYDATHRVDSIELCEHLENCPAQVCVLSYKYTVGEPGTNEGQFLPVANRDIESSENWDDETVSTYDPGHRLQDPSLLVQLKGATPSERKAFRRQREQLCQAANTGYNAESFIHKNEEPEAGELDEAAGVTPESEEAAACATPLPPSLPPSARLKNEQEMYDRNPRRRAQDSDDFNSYNGAAQDRKVAAAKSRDYSKHFPTPGEFTTHGRSTANTGAVPKSYKQAVKNSFESMIYDKPNTSSTDGHDTCNGTLDNVTSYSATMDTSSSTCSSPDKGIFRKYKGPAFPQKNRESGANINIGHQKNKYMKNGLLGEKHYMDSGFPNSNHASYSNDKNAARGNTFDLGTLGNAIPNDYKAPLPPSWGKLFKGKNRSEQAKMCDVMKGNNLSEAFEGKGWKDEMNKVGHDDGAGNPENQGCKKKPWFQGWCKKYESSDSDDGNSGMDYAI